LVTLEGEDDLHLRGTRAMEHIRGSCSPIPITAPGLVAKFRKRNNKAKINICDAVRDHIIPHLTGKACAYEIWASLCKLYERSNEKHKMVLHDQLRGIRMLKDESVTSFLGCYT